MLSSGSGGNSALIRAGEQRVLVDAGLAGVEMEARLELAVLAGDLRLRDVEDADFAEVTISAPLLKRYKANLTAYCDQLRDFCLRRDMSLLTVRSDTPIETLVLDYLRKRGVVK